MCAQLLVWQNLFRTDCFIPRFDRGLVVQNHVQQGIVDFQFAVVFDKTQFAEFVHEKAHARSGRADHLRQCFLTELSRDRLRPIAYGVARRVPATDALALRTAV